MAELRPAAPEEADRPGDSAFACETHWDRQVG